MSLKQIKDNFIWRIESITPTYSLSGLKASFKYIGNTRLMPDESLGLSRAFTVTWEGRNGYQEPICGPQRISNNQFEVTIYYSLESYTLDAIQDIITSDQVDISAYLDNTEYYVGYNSSNTTTDIGLKNRYVTGVSALVDNAMLELKFLVNATILETYSYPS